MAGTNPSEQKVDPTALYLKIGFIIFIFFLTIGSGIMPLKLQAFKNSTTSIGLANAFSGGLFLSIALFHVLPDIGMRYVEMMNLNGIEAPFPYILMFVGYTIVLTVDRVVFDSHALFDDHGEGGHGHGEAEALDGSNEHKHGTKNVHEKSHDEEKEKSNKKHNHLKQSKKSDLDEPL
jgi:zinc transporter 1/2/3